MHDEDDFFNLSKGSLPKPVQSRPKSMMTTYSTKAARKNAALMSSATSAGPSTRVVVNKRKGAPSPMLSSPHDGSSSSSSSSDDSDSESDSDNDDILMGTQERKEKRKKGLKKLTKSRKEKQNKPRRQTTPPTESSKKLGKRRIVEPSEDSDEIDELASSPFILPSPPKVEEDDFRLPSPPKPVWKPRSRPSFANGAEDQLNPPGTPNGRGIPPIESDKTLPESTDTSAEASTPPPPSYMLQATQYPASGGARRRPDSPEDFALPPPLQKSETEWEDLDEEIDQLEPTAAPAGGVIAKELSIEASQQHLHHPTPPPGDRPKFAPDSDAMDAFDDLVAAAEQGDGHDFGGDGMEQEDMFEPPADMLQSSSGPPYSAPKPPLDLRKGTSTVKSSIAPWNSSPIAKRTGPDASPIKSGASSMKLEQRKQGQQTSRRSVAGASAANSQPNDKQSSSQVKHEGESPVVKAEKIGSSSKKNTSPVKAKVPSLEHLVFSRTSTGVKRKSVAESDQTFGEERGNRKKQRAFVLQEELHQDDGEEKDVEEEELAQCSYCKKMFPLAVLDSHEQEEQDLLDAKSVKVAREMSATAGPTSSAVRRDNIAKQAVQKISDKLKADQTRRQQGHLDTPVQQANPPFRKTVNPARPPLQKEPTREELADELFPASPARYTSAQKGKKRARSVEAPDVLQPRQVQNRVQSPSHNVPFANQRITRAGQNKIQQGNRKSAGKVIEIDGDDEAELWEDDDMIPDETVVPSRLPKATTSKQAAGVRNIQAADDDSDDGTPPAGSIYLSKIPSPLRNSYYRILGLDENGRPSDEVRRPVKKKKGARQQEDSDEEDEEMPTARQKARKTPARGRKTWNPARRRRR